MTNQSVDRRITLLYAGRKKKQRNNRRQAHRVQERSSEYIQTHSIHAHFSRLNLIESDCLSAHENRVFICLCFYFVRLRAASCWRSPQYALTAIWCVIFEHFMVSSGETDPASWAHGKTFIVVWQHFKILVMLKMIFDVKESHSIVSGWFWCARLSQSIYPFIFFEQNDKALIRK